MNREKRLEQLMAVIHEEMLENMRRDLEDPDKRTPQLYNAIIKELQRNGIDCVPKRGEDQDNALFGLLEATQARLAEEQDQYSFN